MQQITPVSHHKAFGNPRIFRSGTTLEKVPMNFLITQGGVGDYICLLSALEWIAKNHPQVIGRVYCVDWFLPIAENVLGKYPDWKVYEKHSFDDKKMKSRPTFFPLQAPINRIGANALDLGFIYYLNMTPAPADAYYSKLDFSNADFGVPKQAYAVMTPGASNEPKTMRPETFNDIKLHLLGKGIVPLFLGNRTFRSERPKFHPDYDLSGGVDLTDQTTLLQAAGIISQAKLIVGIDNGLLHLAAMTETPIVYGYTISSIEHTRPRRESGKIYDIAPDPDKLTCTFCQSKIRMVRSHDFATCMYGDTLCTKALENATPWCTLIDQALNG